MSHHTEIDRIDEGNGLATLPTAPWEFDLDLGSDPIGVISRVRSVAREIASQQGRDWPDDADWKTRLPSWLIQFMPELSPEECEHLMAATPREKWNTLPWLFGSWLDAMRERGWEWWGYECSGDRAKIVLQITSVPGRVEAFKQVLLAAGAKVLKERY